MEDNKMHIEMPIEVHTYDVDYMNIVNNTVYPKFFEDMRMRILDKYFPLSEMLKDNNSPILAQTTINYKRPLTLKSKPTGKCTLVLKGASRWQADFEIVEGDTVYCTGQQIGYYFSMTSLRPVRFPEIFIEKYLEK